MADKNGDTTSITGITDTHEKLEELIKRVKEAQKIFATYPEEKINKIFKAAATAADKARIPLAKMAVEEPHCNLLSNTHVL